MPWDAQGNWIPEGATQQGNVPMGTPAPSTAPSPQTTSDVSAGVDPNGNAITAPNDPAFDYGGYAGGALDATNRMRAGQQWAESRKAAQLDPVAYQAALKAAQGDPNSTAQQALRQGVAGAQQSQQAIGASARGGPQAAAAAQQATQGQAALIGQQGTNQAQMLKAQEMVAGRAQLGQLASTQLGANLSQQQQNDALAANYLGKEMGINTAQLQAYGAVRGNANQIGSNADKYNFHPGDIPKGTAGAVGSVFGPTTSDIRAKQDIRPAGGVLGYANQEARQKPFQQMNSESFSPQGGANTSRPMDNRVGMPTAPTSQQMGSFSPGVYAAQSQGMPPTQPGLPNTVSTAPAAYSTQPTAYQAGRFVSDREAKMEAHAEGVRHGLELSGADRVRAREDRQMFEAPLARPDVRAREDRERFGEGSEGGAVAHPFLAQSIMRRQEHDRPVRQEKPYYPDPEHVRAATSGAVRGALESVKPSSGHLLPPEPTQVSPSRGLERNYSGPARGLMPWIGEKQAPGPMPSMLPPSEPRQELYRGTPKAVFSDEKGKKEKHSEAESFLDSLHGGYSYRYKDPSNEPSSEPTGGRYLGVMAQDLEKSPVGPQIVKDTPKGKVLEGNALLSALAAGTGNLHERLKRVEKLKSKGRR
jgi:hypothetical protein